jgi:hypothetical protein
MHPSSLLSYYPTYAILDEIVNTHEYKKLNIFIDLKNNLQSTYMEHAIVNIVEASKKSKTLDTSIFSSLIAFLTFHKIYGIKRGIDLNFIIFFETGRSFYHKNLSKYYKVSRRIDDLYGLDVVDRDLFFETLQANYQLVESVCNKIPNVTVVRLPNLEADFVPYYMITRGKVEKGMGVGNVVYSNDHDLHQCLEEHVFIFSKSARNKKILKHGNVMEMFLRKPNTIPDEYLPLAMAVIGDPGDDVEGVKGIGPATFLKVFNELISITGNLEQIYDKVLSGKDLFENIPKKFKNKKMDDIVSAELKNKKISTNLKLVSFELISRAVEEPNTTEMRDKRVVINDIFKTTSQKVTDPEKMKKALVMNNIVLEDTSIDFLYL